MVGLLERLDLRPEVCVLYGGHNDRSPAFPGLTLAMVARGESARTSQRVPPVSLDELQANLEALGARCGSLYAMEELSLEEREALAEVRSVMQQTPGVRWMDGAGRLEALGVDKALADTVHLSPDGHAALGALVADRTRARSRSPAQPDLLREPPARHGRRTGACAKG
mgnify:CR=1 FL=1